MEDAAAALIPITPVSAPQNAGANSVSTSLRRSPQRRSESIRLMNEGDGFLDHIKGRGRDRSLRNNQTAGIADC